MYCIVLGIGRQQLGALHTVPMVGYRSFDLWANIMIVRREDKPKQSDGRC